MADCCTRAACASKGPTKACGSRFVISTMTGQTTVLQLQGYQQRCLLSYLQLYDTVCNLAAPEAAEIA